LHSRAPNTPALQATIVYAAYASRCYCPFQIWSTCLWLQCIVRKPKITFSSSVSQNTWDLRLHIHVCPEMYHWYEIHKFYKLQNLQQTFLTTVAKFCNFCNCMHFSASNHVSWWKNWRQTDSIFKPPSLHIQIQHNKKLTCILILPKHINW